MHEYDVALKRILMRPGSTLLTTLTGSSSLRWLNVEAPLVRNLRVDLLGESPAGELIQIEFQSRNERCFPLRMGEYLFSIAARHGRLPRQIVLYVGDQPMKMKDRIETPECSLRFHLVDVRDLDGPALLASPNLGDNVISVLTRLGGQMRNVRRIIKRIAESPANDREQALAELLIVAGLRRLNTEVRREAAKMPILNDIMDDELFGPLIRQGRAEGRAEGQMELLLRQIAKRFGPVSPALRKRLAGLKPAELERAGLRLLDARRVEDLFAR